MQKVLIIAGLVILVLGLALPGESAVRAPARDLVIERDNFRF